MIQTSLSLRETWRKGPVPGYAGTERRLPPCSSRVFFLTMMFQPLAKAPSMKARGRDSLRRNSMRWGSSTAMSDTTENSVDARDHHALRGRDDPLDTSP